MTREEYLAQLAYLRFLDRSRHGYNSTYIPKHVPPKAVPLTLEMRNHWETFSNADGCMSYHGFKTWERWNGYVLGVVHSLYANRAISTERAYLLTYVSIMNRCRWERVTPFSLIVHYGLLSIIDRALDHIYSYGQEFTNVQMTITPNQCHAVVERLANRFLR